jgi:hypothetical protein
MRAVIEAASLSVRTVNAISARFRRSMSVIAGMLWMTCRIGSRVGMRAGRVALAIRVSLTERLKYSASE